LFLQVLDDGRLTDGQGRVVDFRNTVIVMTSNLGAVFLNDMGDGPVKPQTKELVMTAIRSHFPPEFINRVDEIVIFVSICSSYAGSCAHVVCLHSAPFHKRTC
jgi:ATP-dependent Clp protease ATP-binding subunit ClpB